MKVLIPSPLRSYTSNASSVEAEGGTLAAVLIALDREYPGIRFRIVDEQDRIREHIKIFVNADQRGDLNDTLASTDEVQIVCALSGGQDLRPGWRGTAS